MRLLSADLARFTTAGFGTVRVPDVEGLRPGDAVAVTVEDAELLETVVLAVRDGEVDVRVWWDSVPGP